MGNAVPEIILIIEAINMPTLALGPIRISLIYATPAVYMHIIYGSLKMP